MNKFHKTAYSRGNNCGVVGSAHGRRSANLPAQQPECLHRHFLDLPARKTEADPAQLLADKLNPPLHPRPQEIASRKVHNRSEAKFYDSTTGLPLAR